LTLATTAKSTTQKYWSYFIKAELTHQSPLLRRLWAYLQERFPLGQQGLLIVSYYSSNQFLAHVLLRPENPMHYSWSSLGGAAVLLCFFFHLRVFDEHKDFVTDSKHYPDRVLQRGLITLTHLKIMGGIAIGIELLLCALNGLPALLALSAALLFSILMLKEFFVGKWLEKHFILYAVSHMLVMPLLALMIFSYASGAYFWQAPFYFKLYAWVGFFVTFNWEISRKIRAPEDEREGIETYSHIFGTYNAARIVLGIRVVDTAMVAFVGYHLSLPLWFYGALIGLFILCLFGYVRFRRQTTARNAQRLETYAGLYIIAFDLILALAIIGRNGLAL
jgi:4-hydroxybenzoate polyprenyltransferase